MYTLYYTTRSYTTESTALIPRIALEEIGAPYEVVEVELEPEPPAWYLDLNPHGKIPSLLESQSDWATDALVYPSSAILLYLTDRHPEAELFPSDPRQRGDGFRIILDMAEMLQSGFIMFFYPERYTTREEDDWAVRDKAVEWLVRYWRRTDDSLRDSPYLVGGRYSICDIYLYVLARWYVDVRGRIGGGPLPPFEDLQSLAASCALIESRPAVARSLAADDLGPIAAGMNPA
jgi:glutathione S-transferase